MSKTDRHEKTEPKERPFPYIPNGVPILQVGRPYSADDNTAYIRALLVVRDPDFAAGLETDIKKILNETGS